MTTLKMKNYIDKPYLEIILGCMYAKKTSKLIDIYDDCKICNVPVYAINHSLDTRYSDGSIVSHDGREIPCVMTSSIMSLIDNVELKRSSVVLINEGQFFDDLKIGVEMLLSKNKNVYVCGLDGDFERNKFGQMLDLIPICDEVYKLKALCMGCKDGSLGLFSKRITTEKCQLVIGSDNYYPACRKCYESVCK